MGILKRWPVAGTLIVLSLLLLALFYYTPGELNHDLILGSQTFLILAVAVALVFIFGTLYLYKSKKTLIFKDLFLKGNKVSEIQHELRTTLSQYSIDDGVITTDASGLVNQMNEIAEHLTGWKESEARGKILKEVFNIINEDARQPINDPILKVIENGASVNFGDHTHLISRQGVKIPIIYRGSPIRDQHGNIKGVVLVFRDQIEERIKEKRLIENEERLRLSLYAANQGLYDLNVQTGDAIVNDEYILMLGYDPGTFTETNNYWMERLHPDDKERTTKAYQDYINGKTSEYKVEFRQKTFNNEWKWILSLGKIVEYDKEGKPLRMLGTHTDITERKKAEEALRESELTFRALAEYSPVGIFRADAARNTIYVNPRWCEISKLSFEEALGFGWLNAVHPDDRSLITDGWKKSSAGKSSTKSEYRFLHKDGTITWVLGSAVPLKNNMGSVIGYIGTVTDITETKQSEQALKLSEAKLNESQKVARIGHYSLDIANDSWTSSPMLDEIFGIDKSVHHNIAIWSELIHPEDKEEMMNYFRNNILKERNKFDKEYRIIRNSDKKVIWVHGLGELEFDNAGNPKKMFGTIQDITNRKKAEDTLKKNEEKLLSIFRAAPTGIGVVNNRILVEVNDRICEMLGYTKEELIGKSSRIVYPNDAEFNFVGDEKYRQIKEFGTGTVETRWQTKDGRILDILLSSTPINIKDLGEGVTFTALDITDRKKTENAIRMFQFATDKAADAVFWIKRDGSYYYVNDQACRSLGYKCEELIQLNISDIDPVLSKETWENAWKRFHAGQIETEKIESFHRKKDGTVFPVEVTAKHYWFGEIELLVVYVRDITYRKKSEETLRKLSQAVEQSNVSIIITDKDGKIEYVNPKFTEVTGYSIEEVIGQNPHILKSGKQPEEFYKELWDTILSGKGWQGEIYNKKKNGEFFWERVLISPIVNEYGKITHFVAVKEDTTDKKNMIEELIIAKERAEEMNRAKSSFFANMSHELRTPFVGILGFAELLKETLTDPDQKEYASQILKSSKRLTETLNKILDFSRLGSSRYELNLTDVDINELIKETGELFVQYAKVNNSSIRITTEFDNKKIKSDLKLLEEILTNLINNAVKFTHNGTIEISSKKIIIDKKDFLEITVADSGIGIPRDRQNIIWHEFRQASEGLNRSFEGTGLGLTITKKYVEMLDGQIHLASEEGKGSVFTVLLPVSFSENRTDETENNNNSIPDAAEEPEGKKNKLLIVEDDSVSTDYLKRILNSLYDIDAAVNALTALALTNKNVYDLMILDINLGKGMDGIELMQEIRKSDKYKNTPIIAVTAYAAESDMQEFLSKGFSHYISKPFSAAELKRILKEITTGKP